MSVLQILHDPLYLLVITVWPLLCPHRCSHRLQFDSSAALHRIYLLQVEVLRVLQLLLKVEYAQPPVHILILRVVMRRLRRQSFLVRRRHVLLLLLL